MNPTEDLAVLAQQEALLRFPAFDAETAWQLGSLLRAALVGMNAGGTVEIERDGQLLFACATPGAKPTQADWIRRKRNTVQRFHRSSYAIGRELARDSATLESAHGLSEIDYAAHGGGFPLWLQADPAAAATEATGTEATGTEAATCVGSIILSGLPQRDDHNLVVNAIAEHLCVAIPHLA
jgi:uncharacterized protein (UPF0303 family)